MTGRRRQVMTKAPDWPAIRSHPATPSLAGGNCSTGRAGLPASAWDEDADPEDRELAVIACGWCPARGPCQAWVMSLPPRGGYRPRGVTAGVLRRSRDDAPDTAAGTARAGLATATACAGPASATAQQQQDVRIRARAALLRDPRRSDRAIAAAARVHRKTVAKIRRELQDAGGIGCWQDKLTPGRVHDAVTRALIRDAARVNTVIAEQTGASRGSVAKIRCSLEDAGLIVRWRSPGYPRGGRRSLS